MGMSASKRQESGILGMTKKLREKWNEALQAVLPIIAIVLVLCFVIAPISSSILLCFLLGAVLLLAGMMLFTLGAELAMSPMGERVGTCLTKSRKLPVVIGLSFLLGFIITISEPDLQVLANQVPAVPNMTLILSVACGVGAFLVVALLRMLFSVALPPLLLVFYGVVFVLALFVPKDFLSVAFDSGGVTTGPMTVPFIMALGVGISATRSDRHAADDSFGLVALCSIGPILAVMILSMIFKADSSAYTPPVIPEIGDSKELFLLFARELPAYMKEIAVSLLPIILFFMIFQIFMLKLTTRKLKKIAIGLVYTYAGLVLFLTGVNVGFMPAGNYLGQVLAKSAHPLFLVPIAMIMGYFIVKAEPAVYVLNKQVEGDHGRSDLLEGHGNGTFPGCCGFSRTCDGAGTHRDLDPVVSHSGIRDRVGNLVFCAEDLYSNRLRLRRRGIGTDDGSVSASDGTGSLLRSWRKHCHRCLRCGRDGCHDTTYHDPGHGAGFENKSEARSAGRNVRSSWTVRGIRGV